MNLSCEIPPGAEFESHCGLFYRQQDGELFFYNNAKGGWCMSSERPFLRPIESYSLADVEEITALPVEYCQQIEIALLKKCIEIEIRKGHPIEHAESIGHSQALKIIETITEDFLA